MGLGAAGPAGWPEVLRLIKEERRAGPPAPVDTAGAEVLADPAASERDKRFHVLIALFLSRWVRAATPGGSAAARGRLTDPCSSQTKDPVTAQAVRNLQALPGSLTPENLALNVSEAAIDAAIAKVGFHATKAKRMKALAQMCHEKHGGDIPPDAAQLMELPGIGPKMAFIAMNVAWGKAAGVGVDTHVHRLCNRLGWVDTKTPEKTRLAVEQWLPIEEWIDFNPTLVGFAQLRCRPIGPTCDGCPVRHRCPVGRGEKPPNPPKQPKKERNAAKEVPAKSAKKRGKAAAEGKGGVKAAKAAKAGPLSFDAFRFSGGGGRPPEKKKDKR